ncbi:MCE family protein [Speluncibacter jeojiensis]|uniref:MCE family protein n=1 Tax=Speluncibacter jeojiensis TaxID=2710754 RepID=A0A9X4M6K3_9ACTN|nr:MlaD family protein [Rhodococcus sp. D2-41]MDG3016158.1 MCE family protein [Corynebacteriales bacterium D3-21]
MKSQFRGLAGPLTKLIIFAVVTVLLTGVLAATIANIGGGSGQRYNAMFSDVTSLNIGDDVRIAGVRVGQVTAIKVVNHNEAEVQFAVSGRSWLPASTIATIKYRNLIGQRYISLSEGPGEQGRKLAVGSTMPLSQTRPALNLTTLFNGFRPLFQTLQPEDVNKLSYEIVQVFQGEGGSIADLVDNTATLTNTVADKDKVIGEVITNLNNILATVNKRGDELSSLIVNTQHLVDGLAADKATIGSAVTNLADLTTATAGLLDPTRPSIQGTIAGINGLSTEINKESDAVNKVLATLPKKYEALDRTAMFGSWFQFYLCGIDIVAGPGSSPHLNLPTGLPTVNQPIWTFASSRCTADGNAAGGTN